jgi:hypothetical protein
MATYFYDYHDERGEFRASVEDRDGNVIWSVRYPDLYEDEDGELIESTTIFEDGYMDNVDDIDGLEAYLKNLNVIKNNDYLSFGYDGDYVMHNEVGYVDAMAKGGKTRGIEKGDIVRFKKDESGKEVSYVKWKVVGMNDDGSVDLRMWNGMMRVAMPSQLEKMSIFSTLYNYGGNINQ